MSSNTNTASATPVPRPRPGAVAFVALAVIGSVILLSYLGSETKFSSKGSLVAQPRFWPAVGVIGMVGFGLLHLITSARMASIRAELQEAVGWLRALEFLIWFMAYVWLVPKLGYLPSTLIFTTALALRMGYRTGRMLGLAALAGLTIVVVFKTLLSVKIPGGTAYEALPDGVRNFMILNF